VKYALLKYRFSSLNTVYLCVGIIVRYISWEVYCWRHILIISILDFDDACLWVTVLVRSINILSVIINRGRWSVMICDSIVVFDFYFVCRGYINLGWSIVIEKNVKCFDWNWRHSSIKQKLQFIYLLVHGSYYHAKGDQYNRKTTLKTIFLISSNKNIISHSWVKLYALKIIIEWTWVSFVYASIACSGILLTVVTQCS